MTTTTRIPGIHHITAIAGEPQRNLDFYTGALGLRMVKLTVNFDDPYTYHFYFADRVGSPGTLLTFFPWAGATPGVLGAGQVSATAFAAPVGATNYWEDRLRAHSVDFRRLERFGDPVLAFSDPDGLPLEIVANAAPSDAGVWEGSSVPAEYALQGFHSATLLEADPDAAARLLTDTFGFNAQGEEAGRLRLHGAAEGPGTVVDVVRAPRQGRGFVGAGSVHHIAWRARTDAEQLEWREKTARLGLHVTPVIDRNYFHSIYFREPGGILFEIATDPPGMAIDEPESALGTTLRLPKQYEGIREKLEARLPKLRLPQEVTAR
jgi:glyoxalase family protein